MKNTNQQIEELVADFTRKVRSQSKLVGEVDGDLIVAEYVGIKGYEVKILEAGNTWHTLLVSNGVERITVDMEYKLKRYFGVLTKEELEFMEGE